MSTPWSLPPGEPCTNKMGSPSPTSRSSTGPASVSVVLGPSAMVERYVPSCVHVVGDVSSTRRGTMGRLRKDEKHTKRRFKMQQRLLSIGDDFWIEDENGTKAFLVDGKALRVRDTWILKDHEGKEVATIK